MFQLFSKLLERKPLSMSQSPRSTITANPTRRIHSRASDQRQAGDHRFKQGGGRAMRLGEQLQGVRL